MLLESIGLLLSAISVTLECSDGIISRIVSYRKYNTRVSALVTRVVSLRIRFRNTARILASVLRTNGEVLESWLSQQKKLDGNSGLSFAQRGLEQQCKILVTGEELVGQVKHCIHLVNSIKDTLETIEKELTRYAKGKMVDDGNVQQFAPSTSANIAPIIGKTWEKLASSRVAFAISRKDESFSKTINQLSDSNDNFAGISSDIIKAIDAISRYPRTGVETPNRRSAADVNVIEKYKQIRSASKTLYHTMAKDWACSRHQRHSVSVSFVEGNQQSKTIKFDIAMLLVCQDPSSSDPSQSTSNQAETLWLEIEHSEIKSQEQGRGTGTTPGVESFASEVLDKLDTALNTQTRTLPIIGGNPLKASIDSDNMQQDPDSETQLTDLLSVNDFCHHFFQQYRTSSDSPQRTCLGCLKGQSIQRFYLQPAERRYSGDVHSLSSLISWIGEQHYMRVLDPDLAHRMAGDLAMSVLHFHNTPWLCETWRSKDVQFFNRGGFSKYKQLNPSSPRLQVELERQSASITLPSTRTTQNELPFRFGIVLLELGLSRTWESLREEGLAEFDLPERKQNDYHVAVEWWKKMKALKRVGPKYLRITWDCITWDFSPNRAEDEDDQIEEGDQILFFANAAGEIRRLDEGLTSLMQGLC